LRIIAGPHRIDGGAWSQLVEGRWRVDPISNRVGVRLVDEDGPSPSGVGGRAGGVPADRGSEGGRSTGMVTGAVQLPPDGGPIILLPDHATVGGYPVVGCVIAADLSLAGQLAPGDRVRFTDVDLDTAHRAWSDRTRRIDRRVHGWFPTAAGT
jgi:allophanate hydrolase subunit 2